ncbi:CD63 antigen-like isoform X2 [Cimex lectularius]|uniref:Tetraspanin n=1 Tax=Cimex lectularius TaxID=79782 RepID=A0A8I6RI19_CIMLE|nr:CD63 antigen-like isoform X2 [Cimex lectularius]
MGFCECTTKFLLFVFNLACAVLGILIITIGILTNINGGSIKSLLHSELTTTSIVFIVIGCLVFLISFFGCCGVARESHCMITTYAVILSAILLVQIAIGVLAFVYHKNITSEIKTSVENTFADYDNHRKEIDVIQKELKCCGSHGPSYFPTRDLPSSCCGTTGETCPPNRAYQDGCYDKVVMVVKSQLKTIGLAALIIAAVEFFCVACAYFLAKSFRNVYV